MTVLYTTILYGVLGVAVAVCCMNVGKTTVMNYDVASGTGSLVSLSYSLCLNSMFSVLLSICYSATRGRQSRGARSSLEQGDLSGTPTHKSRQLNNPAVLSLGKL